MGLMRSAVLCSFILMVMLTGCVQTGKVPVLPATAAEWTLDPASYPGDQKPPQLTATYKGAPDITVRLTQKGNQTLAFSDVQSWRAEPGKLAFYKGSWFGVAESAGADQRLLNRFVTAFQKQLPDSSQ